jgi:hypothetical protein
VFLTLVPAYQEPGIAATLRGLLGLRYPGERARYAVVTKSAEDAAPHPAMPASTGALCQQFLGDLPPYAKGSRTRPPPAPGAGRAAQLGAPPEALARAWRATPRIRRELFVGCSTPIRFPIPTSAGSPASRGPRALFWGDAVARELGSAWDRGRICAVQRSSIFTRVSLALMKEVRRIRLIDRATA